MANANTKEQIKAAARAKMTQTLTSQGNSQSSTNSSGTLSSYMQERSKAALERKKAGISYRRSAQTVNDDYISAFVRDANSFLTREKNNYNGLTYGSATSRQGQDSRVNTWNNLSNRAGQIKDFLQTNKGRIDQKSYDDLMRYVDSFTADGKNLNKAFDSAYKYYDLFDSEDDYNSYRYFTSGDARSAQDLITASNAGLSAYERDRAAALDYKNSNDGKLEQWITRMAEVPLWDSTPIHMQNVQLYRNDDSYKQMNDRWSKGQQMTFGYLYSQDPEKAAQYAIQVNNSLNAADKDAQRQAAVDKATSSPWAGAWATGKAIFGNMTGIGDFANDLAEYQARGTITERGGLLTPAEYGSAVTSGISQHLNDKFGTIDDDVFVFGGKGLGDLYGLGTSVAQSMLSGHMLGKSGTLLSFFGSAAASTADDARSRGATDEQALALGTLSGIAEGAAEMIGVDNLLKRGAADTFRGFLRNTFRQGISEGVEEGLTSLFNNIAEDIVMGENSKFYDLVDAYVQGGLTPEEAKKKAWVDCVEEMLFDAAGGFASGNVSGGMETVIQTGSRNRAAKRYLTDSAQELVDAGLQSPEGSKYNQMASDAQKRLDAGKTLSGGQLYRLQSANDQQMLNSDTQSIQKAVEVRLTELGETGDIAGISAAIAKQVSTEAAGSALPYQAHYLSEITDGKNRDIRAEISHERFLETSQQKLTNAERKLISESKFGQRVLNELNTENIRSGNFSTDWTGNIGTESLNAAEYGRNLKEPEVTAAEQTAVPQSQNRPATDESKAVKTPEATKHTSKFEQVQAKAEASGKEATIEDYASAYGKQSKAVIAVYELGDGKQNPAKFAQEYEMVYNWGASGISESFAMNPANQVKNSVLTDAQRLKAYQIGKLAAADSAKALTARNGITGRTASNWKKGVLKGHGVAVSEVEKAFAKHNGKQVKAIRVLRNLAEVTGIDIVLYKSSAGSDGFLRGETIDGVDLSDAQGAFAWKNDKLYIDINAGLENAIDFGDVAKYTMLRTFGHEFTHFCEKWNPEEYNSFRQLVFDHMERKGENVHALIEAKQEAGMSYEEASREVVAEAMTDILPETSFAQELAQKHQNLFQKLLEKLKDFLNDIKEYFNGLAGNLDPGAEAMKTEIDGTMRYLEDIVKAYDQLAIHAVENYQAAKENVSDQTPTQEMSNEEAFMDSATAVQNQIRPPYSDGSKAFNTFADGLQPEARKTFDLFYGFYQRSRITNTMSVSGKRVKAVNISSLYLMAQDWNAMLAKEPKWAEAARDLAQFLPEDVRKRMNMNADGTLTPSTMEKEFKMPSSLAQRLVDALPYESIDARYQLGDKVITLPEGKARQSVGGEAYRRAILTETRKLYSEGKLRPVGIGTMSKDRWGSLGFLAANGKTGASGDFTTVCPQMMFNRGCWYCYRRAAMEKGVNNKLVAQNVWYTGEILRIKDADITALNKNGGLRIQSFGDWMPHFSAMLADVLYDAELRGLQVKIITKEPSMINYIAALREQDVGKNLYFNLSSDYTIERGPAKQAQGGDSLDAVNPERPYMRDQDNSFWWKRAMSVEEAARYREKYPWVNTRIVATDVEEFIRGLKDNRVDVVTGYHGNIRGIERVDSTTGARKIEVEALGDAGMPRFAFNPVTGQWVTEYEGKTATHKRLAQAIADNGLQMEYYTKTCCITGRCASCNGKCGALARDFNVKNATNRDAESVAYWQQHMEYAVEPEFGDMTVEQDRLQYQARTPQKTANVRDLNINRRVIDYNDVSAISACVADTAMRLQNAGKVVVIPPGEVARNNKKMPKDDYKQIRDFLKTILRQFLGKTVYFNHNGNYAEAYLTKDGLNHSAGGEVTPERSAISEKFYELVRNAEYSYSSENDRHSNINKKIAGKIDWDCFVAVAMIGDTPYPVVFKLRTTDLDPRSQIYEFFTQEKETSSSHDSMPQNELQNALPNYGGTLVSNDRVPQPGTGVKNQDEGKVSKQARKATADSTSAAGIEYDPTLQDWEVETALFDALDHADSRNDNLIRVGKMPNYISQITGIDGDFYIYRNHAYENMVNEEQAIKDGRPIIRKRRKVDFHNLGFNRMEQAVLSLESPLVTMAVNNPEGNPTLSMVLPVTDDLGDPLYAIMSFYANRDINGSFVQKPHVLLTISNRPLLVERGSGRLSTIEAIEKAIEKGAILDYDKKIRANLPVIAQLTRLGNVTESTLKENIARFQNDVKVFKEEKKISYQKRTNSLSDREVLEYAAIRAELGDLTDGERDALRIFQQRLDKLRDLQVERERMGSLWHSQQFGGGDRNEATKTLNRMHILDSQIERAMSEVLSIEDKNVLQRVLKKARGVIRDDEANKHRAVIQRRRDSSKESELRHKIQKIVNDLNRLLLRGDKKNHVPMKLKKAVADALSLVNMDTVGAEERVAKYRDLIAKETDPDKIDAYTVTMENIQRMGEQTGQRLRDLRDAYEEISTSTDPDIVNAYDPVIAGNLRELSQTIGDTALKDMSLEQLQDVYAMYKMVMSAVRNANKIFNKEKAATVQEYTETVCAEMRHNGIRQKDLPEKIQNAASWLNNFSWQNLRPVDAFRRTGSEKMMELFWDFVDGMAQRGKMTAEIRDYLVKARKDTSYQKFELNKAETFTTVDGKKMKLTLAEKMSIYAYSKREAAFDHMTEGGFTYAKAQKYVENGITKYHNNAGGTWRLTLDDLQKICASLTENQRQYVDIMQKFLTEFGHRGNAISRELFGIDLFKEENYFPLMSNHDYLNSVQTDLGATQTVVSLKNSGFTKSTKPHANNPIVLKSFDDVCMEHLDKMMNYIALTLPLENLRKVYDSVSVASAETAPQSTKALIGAVYGEEAKQYFDQFLKDANGNHGSNGAKNPLWKMFSRSKATAVSANFSVVIQQISSVFRASAEISPVHLIWARNYGKGTTRGKKSYQEMMEHTGLATIKAMGGFDVGSNRGLNDYIGMDEAPRSKEKVAKWFQDFFGMGAEYMDKVGWTMIWNAVKREVASRKQYEINSDAFFQACEQRFNEIIVKTQVFDSVLSKSGFMRSDNDSVKYLTSFMGEPTVTAGMVFNSHLEVVRAIKSKKNVRFSVLKLVRTDGALVITLLLNGMLKAIPYAMRDDDEDESFWERWIKHLGENIRGDLNPLNLLPIARDISSIVQGRTVERPDLALLADLFAVGQRAVEVLTDEEKQEEMSAEDFYDLAKDLVGAIGNFSGLPVQNIWRDVESYLRLWKDATDGIEPVEMGESFRRGWSGDEETKHEGLYDAIISGDTARVEVLRATYNSDDSYHSAVRKALREHDPRILQAAQAYYAGDLAEYDRLLTEIEGENHFGFRDIKAAIDAEVRVLEKAANGDEEAPDGESPVYRYTAEDYFRSLRDGNMEAADLAYAELYQRQIDEGYLRHQAESNVKSALVSQIKGAYLDEDIPRADALKLLEDYTDKGETEVKKWDFEIETGYSWGARARGYYLGDIPESKLVAAVMDIEDKSWADALAYIDFLNLAKGHEDVEISADDAAGYFEYAQPAGISVNVWLDYKSGISGYTKKTDKMDVIDRLPISDDKKDAIYFAEGWAESKLHEAPWHQ